MVSTMKKHFLIATVASSLLLTACGGGGGGGSNNDNTPRETTPTDINVAASANGATATATYNSATAANLIDQNADTTWISDDGTSITVDFGGVKAINKITLSKVAASTTLGSNPDILVELSTDNATYERSGITSPFVSGAIACTNQNSGAEQHTCEMPTHNARFIRITSQNGKSFEFKELEVIGR